MCLQHVCNHNLYFISMCIVLQTYTSVQKKKLPSSISLSVGFSFHSLNFCSSSLGPCLHSFSSSRSPPRSIPPRSLPTNLSAHNLIPCCKSSGSCWWIPEFAMTVLSLLSDLVLALREEARPRFIGPGSICLISSGRPSSETSTSPSHDEPALSTLNTPLLWMVFSIRGLRIRSIADWHVGVCKDAAELIRAIDEHRMRLQPPSHMLTRKHAIKNTLRLKSISTITSFAAGKCEWSTPGVVVPTKDPQTMPKIPGRKTRHVWPSSKFPPFPSNGYIFF